MNAHQRRVRGRCLRRVNRPELTYRMTRTLNYADFQAELEAVSKAFAALNGALPPRVPQ